MARAPARLGFLAACGLVAAACGPAVVASTSTSTTGEEVTTTGMIGTSSGLTSTSGSGSGSTSWTDGTTTAASSSATQGSSGDTTSSSATTEDPTTTTTTTGAPETCKKLDILTLIIDGGELWDTTFALEKLWPHLAARLEGEFADWDTHVMVANPDGKWGNEYCEGLCGQGKACETEVPYPCWYEPDACDLTRGAGATFPAGGGASNVQCPVEGGQRYIMSGQSDLEGTLSCVGRVGGGHDGGKYFAVAQATLDALDDPMNAPGACNDGFLRDDAYLVLFVVSAYPDLLSLESPEDWTQAVKAHKGGKFDRIYFVGLFQGCQSSWDPWEYEPLFEWGEGFYYHQVDDACADNVIPYVDPALDYVLADCQE